MSTTVGKTVKCRGTLPARVSKSELATFLDLSPRHVQRLTAAGVLVRAPEGGFEFAASIRGHLAYVRADARRKAGSAVEDGLRSAKAAALEARFAREDRNLISMEETRAVLFNIVQIFAQALASLPAELGRSGDSGLIDFVGNAETALRRKLAEQMAKLESGR